MDLAQTIELIQKTAVEADRTSQERIRAIPGDGRHQYVDLSGTGQWELVEVPPPPRNHMVETVEDLIALAKYAQGFSGDDGGPSVWHDEKLIVLAWQDGDVRDRASMPLRFSPQFELLKKLSAAAQPLTHRELVQLLRVDLAGTTPPGLLNSVKQIKFMRNEEGHSTVSNGSESLGRSVEAEVRSTLDEIPEQVNLSIQVYLNQGENDQRWPVVCDLQADVQTQRFVFRALPGEIEQAILWHQGTIRQRLQMGVGESVPVYAGRP
jgi:hypothetical protein